MKGKQKAHSTVDSTIVRTQQHLGGGEGGVKNAIGKSAGGIATKIHVVIDSRGNPRGLAFSGKFGLTAS